MLKKFKVRRGFTVPSQLTWPKKSDGTEVCDNRLNGWLQRLARDPVCRDPPTRGHHIGFTCRRFPSPMGAARGERPEFYIKLPLGSPFLIFSQVYLLKSFPQDSRV